MYYVVRMFMSLQLR